ncbi:uncharacterized protein LOC129187178 isoform X2 [Dunckerocampus dactyliophorus]|uniref:uncharacterized protein LOC129187178 isoform X2 n=1 Tax=Dunckerocampus dactyliophorus TaxID=161453 RepID=UPI0024054454|nr:uncharacterized protein LOC129187178 isoform X2 [Dunckerocampus dactyliophorus]
MVQTCCVINCHNRSRDRSGDKKDGVTFFPFPTWKQSQGAVICELTKRRRMAWIAAVRRPHITFDAITRHMLVCSRHFHTGRPAYEMDESHPDWAPSLHLGHTEVEAADKRLHITLYEEELSPTREENERLRQQLEAVCKTRVVLHVEGRKGNRMIKAKTPPVESTQTAVSLRRTRPYQHLEDFKELQTTSENHHPHRHSSRTL